MEMVKLEYPALCNDCGLAVWYGSRFAYYLAQRLNVGCPFCGSDQVCDCSFCVDSVAEPWFGYFACISV